MKSTIRKRSIVGSIERSGADGPSRAASVQPAHASAGTGMQEDTSLTRAIESSGSGGAAAAVGAEGPPQPDMMAKALQASNAG